MIISAVQSMQTNVIGQTKNRMEARTKKIDGYRYAYEIGGITSEDMDLNEATDIVFDILYHVMYAREVKDLEITKSADTPLFSFRFFSVSQLAECYAIEILWVDKDTETNMHGEPIIKDRTPTYGKYELPSDRENLLPCVGVMEK